MFTAATMTISLMLMLGTHFEAPRELKFQGALLPPAAVAPPSELDELLRTRPSLRPSAIVLSISGELTVATLAVLLVGATVGRWSSLVSLAVGFLVGLPTFIVGFIGGIMMIVAGIRLHAHDARVRELRRREPGPPAPAPVPASVSTEAPGGVVLSRF